MGNTYCQLCHVSTSSDEPVHKECQESFDSDNFKEMWGIISLSYFKQGDDFNSLRVVEDNQLNLVKTLRNHEYIMNTSAEKLKGIADFLENNNIPSNKFRVDADTHRISIYGPPDIMRQLIKAELVNFDGPYVNEPPY